MGTTFVIIANINAKSDNSGNTSWGTGLIKHYNCVLIWKLNLISFGIVRTLLFEDCFQYEIL